MLDNELIYSDAQAPTLVTENVSTFTVDMLKVGDPAKELYLVIGVKVAPTSGGSATVQFLFESDEDDGFATAQVSHYQSTAIAIATLVAGYNVVTMRLPRGIKRHSRVTYTIAVAALTAGSFNAFLTMDPDSDNLVMDVS